jgi:hypothetical protein
MAWNDDGLIPENESDLTIAPKTSRIVDLPRRHLLTSSIATNDLNVLFARRKAQQ